jgi:hypothetical protein
MYKIEKTAGGFTLTFGGLMNKAEHERWVEESERALAGCTKPFGVIVDLRTLKLLSPDAQAVLVQGQGLYKRAGMERSVVILNSPLMTMQAKRLSKGSGIDALERYIDASNDTNWEKHALAWVKSGVDPDK